MTESDDVHNVTYAPNEIPKTEEAKQPNDDTEAEHPESEEELRTREADATAMDAWRVAKSLLVLRNQVNVIAPNRDKRNDGTIGDTDHTKRASDHNPWVADGSIGVVTALDITDSPQKGCSADMIAKALQAAKDPRIKYVIWNGRIMASYVVSGKQPWSWRPYSGSNKHTEHIHVSVNSSEALYDDERAWNLDALVA